MVAVAERKTLPGWRDFERSVAAGFNGIAQESKAIFDVLLPDPENIRVYSGVSCKMRRELNRISRDGRVTLELSNSAGKFWTSLAQSGLNQTNYKDNPAQVGAALIVSVEQWHQAVSTRHGGKVDLDRSFYLSLSWNQKGNYQLHQFSLALPDPATLNWHFPTRGEALGRCLKGDDETGTILEWYGESGGQLKYYPLAANALWQSEIFTLEPLVEGDYGIAKKASAYFSKRWKAASKSK